MSTRHVLDELSPYIDGESRDRERIARHLQSCPSCARQHLELRKLSAHLRALPAPEVPEGFSARIAARLDEAPAHVPLFSPFALRLACAAGVAIAAGGLTLRLSPGARETGAAAPPPAVNLAWQDDDLVVEEFARLMDAGVALDLFGDPDEIESAEDLAPLDEDRVLEALAEGVPEEDLVSDVPDDLAALLDELAKVDAQTLGELLSTYENEG